jgi:hypothetical protein
MKRVRKKDTRPKDRRDVWKIQDLGSISKLTRGTPLEFPFYEIGPPPFNHRCPGC